MSIALAPVMLHEARAAAERIAGIALRTPLVRLPVDTDNAIYLKLENLQPIGAFKIRGAANAMAIAGRDALANGVYTVAPSRSMASVFARGAWSGTTTSQRTPRVRAHHATPCAMLPALAV